MTKEAEALAKKLPALRRFALALTPDPAEADDLVQEAQLRDQDQRGGLRTASNLKSWLFSILKNTFLDRRRHRLSREAAVVATEAHNRSRPNLDREPACPAAHRLSGHSLKFAAAAAPHNALRPSRAAEKNDR